MLFARFFPNDDIGQRLLTFLYMAIIGLMAFNIHDVTGSQATNFLLAYADSKAILAVMYARAWYRHPEYRSFTGAHVVLFSILTVIWVVIAIWEPYDFAW